MVRSIPPTAPPFLPDEREYDMRALHRKLLRDVWNLRGPALAIAVVIVAGVATFVASFGTMEALLRSRDAFYADARFADAFATVKRAPLHVADRLRHRPGISTVQARVQTSAKIQIPDFPDPISGVVLSLPDGRRSVLNQLILRRGRLPHRGRTLEVAVSEAFATAHELDLGDTLATILDGQQRTLSIVGVVLSPEYVYQIKPGGLFPDAQRFGVLWMRRSDLAAASDMEGAFNDIALSFAPGAHPQDVLDHVDQILAPYGAQDAILRNDQLSNRYLNDELQQLERMATTLPVTFLGVAAFLLNVVIGRLIRTQRDLIAVLKAFGYRNRAVGIHYGGLVILIVSVGALGGTALGAWLGHAMADLYLRFFSFPTLHYQLRLTTVLLAVGVTGVASLGGALWAVRGAVRLPPAEAMRPEPPHRYRKTIAERLGLTAVLDPPTRMILRNIERRPFRALLTVVGMAASVAIVVSGTFVSDAVDAMVETQFHEAQREDLAVTFIEPTSVDALYEIRSIPGVQYAEPVRTLPVRLRHEHRTYRTGIQGVQPRPFLHRPLTVDLRPIDVPSEGVVLTSYLADILQVDVGDRLTVEVLTGERPVRPIPVSDVARQYIGVGVYMHIDAANRLMREGPTHSGAFIAVDPHRRADVETALTERPRVAAVTAQARAIASFRETMAETVLTLTFILTLFAASIAFGVVYNNARIALSERARELASLRVLGLSQGDIGYILLGELALLTVLSLPLGWLLGWALAYQTVAATQTELFRLPLVIQRDTFAFASTIVLGAAIVSGAVLWYRLARRDLIEVLKTRE